MSGAIAHQLDLSCNSLDHTKNVSDNIAVVRYAECPDTDGPEVFKLCVSNYNYVHTKLK